MWFKALPTTFLNLATGDQINLLDARPELTTRWEFERLPCIIYTIQDKDVRVLHNTFQEAKDVFDKLEKILGVIS